MYKIVRSWWRYVLSLGDHIFGQTQGWYKKSWAP